MAAVLSAGSQACSERSTIPTPEVIWGAPRQDASWEMKIGLVVIVLLWNPGEGNIEGLTRVHRLAEPLFVYETVIP